MKNLTLNSRDQYIGSTLQGNTQQVLKEREEISIEQILETECEDRGRVVLVVGAPGIGKSTLIWELCRKWEEFSCIKKYGLVVLLRLREEVQKITSVSQLFYSCCDPSLADEVIKNQGSGILFILDGFNELPLKLQEKGFLLDLIGGRNLPDSKVLVTSRPSATAGLLTCCRPQIQKCIETELYKQLSLTILNRHLEVRVGKFEDLPRSLHDHFIALSNLAYNGFVNEEVIFHSLSPIV